MPWETERITPRMIEAAAVKTRLKLIRGDWGDTFVCGCPLVLLAIANRHYVSSNNIEFCAMEYSIGRFGASYTYGFLYGFDGTPPNHQQPIAKLYPNKSRFKLGRKDGSEVYHQLNHLITIQFSV